jgi:hypothetical protein
MRLEGLFVVEVPRDEGTGTRKECRACGMLYELADEGWDDPDAVKIGEDTRKSDVVPSSEPMMADGEGTYIFAELVDVV